MRRVLGAWLVFLIVAGPGIVERIDEDVTILSSAYPAPYRKHPPVYGQDPGRSAPSLPRGAAARSAGSANPSPGSPQKAHNVPPAFIKDPLEFLSSAPPDSLRLLPGIGPVLADRIAGARGNARRYGTWSDLLRVDGIGPGTIAKLQNLSSSSR